MNTQEVLDNLSRLEQNLQDIDSARRQVETVARSYAATEKQFMQVAARLDEVGEGLHRLFDAVRDRQTMISDEVETQVEAMLRSVQDRMKTNMESIQAAGNQFRFSCSQAAESFDTELRKRMSRLNDELENSQHSFQTRMERYLQDCARALEQWRNQYGKTVTQGTEELSLLLQQTNSDLAGTMQGFQTQIEVSLQQLSNGVTAFEEAVGSTTQGYLTLLQLDETLASMMQEFRSERIRARRIRRQLTVVWVVVLLVSVATMVRVYWA